MPDQVRLTSSSVGSWVIKTRTPPRQIVPGWLAGQHQIVRRCLRPSYRSELMAAGQRCLLWLSGPTEPGVHAIGTLSSPAELVTTSEGPQLEIDIKFQLLEVVVPRADWKADPVLAKAELMRMPAGANPSFLTPAMFSALAGLLPPDARRSARW
jgi:hypothetical protein